MGPSGGEFETRPSLLIRLRNRQDAEAWRTFVDVYGPLVYGHSRRRGLQHGDAEDVTQKVFALVSRAMGKFDYQPDVGRFRDWLGTIVRNEVNRFFKQEARTVRGQGGDDDPLQEIVAPMADSGWTAEFNAHILQSALTRARPRFEPATWQAFERVWLEHRPALQVAQEMGQPIDWVYVAKSRVLKQLWQEVQELAEDTALLAPLSS